MSPVDQTVTSPSPPRPRGRVLPTLHEDGRRNWIRPRLSKGRFLNRRRALGYSLMALFLALPHLTVAGKPAMLLDVPAGRFTLLGLTFTPTETPILMLFLLAVFVGVFLLTALFGRVWCGWACPQTVWMELLFRPLERLFEGSPQEQRRRDRDGLDPRRALKNAVFLLLSFVLGNTFLAYFVGAEQLGRWMLGSPLEHPTAFGVMAATTALVFFDFGWFREQTCMVACPYGRFQSVLLDRQSLVVGYDARRGEPRGKPGKAAAAVVSAPGAACPPRGGAPAGAAGEPACGPSLLPAGFVSGAPPAECPPLGDCIDCQACVLTCPTGIDIRDGLQMECVHCTQCIDACDAIMDRIGRPRGLIRYSSQAELAGEPTRLLRPRVVAYAAVVTGLLVGLVAVISLRRAAEVTLLRTTGVPFIDRGEQVELHLRLKVHNRADAPRTYTVSLAAASRDDGLVLRPAAPLTLDADALDTLALTVIAPRERFTAGRANARLVVDDGQGFREEVVAPLVGPLGKGKGGSR